MSRFPPIPENELSDAQVRIYKGVADVFARLPDHIKWKNDTGLVLGPYSPLFYTAEISDAWFALAFAVTRQQRFTIREKELSILAVISQYDAPYLHYAHSEIAICVGFSQNQVQQAFHGKLPDSLDEREIAIFNLALAITQMRCHMDDATFDKTKRILGRDEIAGVAHIVSGYIYVAILANIGDGDVPKTEEGMFLASKNPALENQ